MHDRGFAELNRELDRCSPKGLQTNGVNHATSIFTQTEIENYANAFFSPKGTQAAMSSALKPAVDRYKSRYKRALERIERVKEQLKYAKEANNDKEIHNLTLALKESNEDENSLDVFKKDMITFVRMYEFLSQIVDYADEDLLKLAAFVKALIPNLKTSDEKDPIDISLIELSHYKLNVQKTESINLIGEDEPLYGSGAGATPKDPEKELLSAIVGEMNLLFAGEWSDGDVLSYARTITGKVSENEKVVQQVANNIKEQAMMGGFADAVDGAVTDSFDAHQKLAMKVLSDDRIKKILADYVYGEIAKGLKADSNNYI